MSSLGWIDFDEAERQRARRIMAMFQERESRDELGLGAIRDSIADHLFPGTSTIQTRLRYMLFVPWIYRMLEERDGSPDRLSSDGRALEIKLINALKLGEGEGAWGVIGRDAGERLQRLPSAVYWAGLGAWGIRLFPGSPEGYFAAIPSLRRERRRRGEEEDRIVHSSLWHPGLPDIPENLLEQATFILTAAEQDFLTDRLVASQPHCLLTMLARNRLAADCDFIWQHPHVTDFPSAAQRLVSHAAVFSDVMHGAALLYNLLLSELRGEDEWVAGYHGRLRNWAVELDRTSVETWSLADFWEAIDHPGHRIDPRAQRFVSEWMEVVRDGAGTVANSPAARQLVQERERRLKTTQSRFINHAMRDRWNGESGAWRLSFRWPRAKAHLKDLCHGR